jgi:hypothetical protein
MWVALVVTRVLASSRHPASPYVVMLIRIVRPGMLLKNAINVLQLLLACHDIAQVDAEEYNNANANADANATGAITDAAAAVSAKAVGAKPNTKTKTRSKAE